MEMDAKIMAKVHHVGLFVSNMDRARHLFQDILEFGLVWHLPMVKGSRMAELMGIPNVQMEIVYLQNGPGNTAVELCRMIHPVKKQSPKAFGSPGTTSLSLNVENLDQLHKRLTREGWSPLSPCLDMRDPEGHPVRIFCFSAEEGVVVELIEKARERDQ
jgi:catechol 2,3-dioxygenase-like lactoylglutathione lyase family enzyme